MKMHKRVSKLYKIFYMQADYEPWWQFDGWEQYVKETYLFETEEKFDAALQTLLKSFGDRYPNNREKEGRFFAFWSDDEQQYCEGCDEDVQIYHGLVLVKPDMT